MASLKDIKRKVTAVQKTKQITRAMNMVAASKFKSAQLKMENFRPYAGKFMDVLNSLALRVESMTSSFTCRARSQENSCYLHDFRSWPLRRF